MSKSIDDIFGKYPHTQFAKYLAATFKANEELREIKTLERLNQFLKKHHKKIYKTFHNENKIIDEWINIKELQPALLELFRNKPDSVSNIIQAEDPSFQKAFELLEENKNVFNENTYQWMMSSLIQDLTRHYTETKMKILKNYLDKNPLILFENVRVHSLISNMDPRYPTFKKESVQPISSWILSYFNKQNFEKLSNFEYLKTALKDLLSNLRYGAPEKRKISKEAFLKIIQNIPDKFKQDLTQFINSEKDEILIKLKKDDKENHEIIEMIINQSTTKDVPGDVYIVQKIADNQKSLSDKTAGERKETVEMDNTLFGHINNDLALAGTTLEGNTLFKTLTYLKNFISKRELKGDHKGGAESEALQKIQDEIGDALKIEAAVKTILDTYDATKIGIEDDKAIHNIAGAVSDIAIKTLKEKKRILMPGGWIGLNRQSGHAMLYEIKQITEGSLAGQFAFVIHNTGSGLEHHKKRSGKKGEEYNSSVKVYLLGNDLAKVEPQLKELFTEVIKPKFVPYVKKKEPKHYSADNLYKIISEKFKSLEFKETDPEPFTKEWTKGQVSGTCSWQVLGSYLKSYKFPKTIHYRHLRYEVRCDSIEEYLKKNKDNLKDGTVQRQMNFALQELARAILRYSQLGILNPSEVEEGVQFINKIETELQKALEEPKKDEEAKREVEVKKQMEVKKDLELPQYRVPKQEKKELQDKASEEKLATELNTVHTIRSYDTQSATLESNQKRDFTAPDYQLEIATSSSVKGGFESDRLSSLKTLNQIDILLNRCQKNFELGHYAVVTQAIEEFYQSLPPGVDIWAALPKERIFECLQKTRALNIHYGAAVAKQDPYPFADRGITFYAGQALLMNVAKHYRDYILTKRAEVDKGKWNDFEQCSWSNYFVTLDKKQNQHCSAILEILNSYSIPHANLYALMDAYRKRYPDKFKKILQAEEVDVKYNDEIVRIGNFHGKVRDLKLDELDKANRYFITHLAELRKEHSELAEEFDVATILNKNFQECKRFTSGELSFLKKNVEDANDTPESNVEANYSYYQSSGKPCTVINFKPPEEARLKFHQYQTQPDVTDPLIIESLNSWPQSSHSIQTDTAKGQNEKTVLTERIALMRSLLNMKFQKSTQVTTTLNFMKKEFFRLTDPDFQTLCFTNVFSYNLLEQQIKDSKETISQMLDLIKRGLKTHIRDGKIRQPTFFFLKFNLSLQKLLNSVDRKAYAEHSEHFNEVGKLIQDQINLYSKKEKNDQNTSTLKQLHAANLIYLDNTIGPDWGLKYDDTLPPEFQSALKSYFYFKNYSSLDKIDPFIEHLAQNAWTHCARHLSVHLEKLRKSAPQKDGVIESKAIQEVLNTLANTLSLERPSSVETAWTGEYPIYRLISTKNKNELLSVDLVNGEVYRDKIQQVPLPSKVYNTPVFNQFVNTKMISALVSKDHTVYEFFVTPESKLKYRFILPNKLQREIIVNGVKAWYEYRSNDENVLPLSFVQSGRSTWVRVDERKSADERKEGADSKEVADQKKTADQKGVADQKEGADREKGADRKAIKQSVIFDNKSQKPVFTYSTSGQILELDEEGTTTDFQLIDMSKAPESIKKKYSWAFNFENGGYIEFWKKEAKKEIMPNGIKETPGEIKIIFRRYNLEFKQGILPDGKLGDIIWTQHPDYKVNINPTQALIPNFNSGIHLTPRKPGTLEDCYVVPKQQYIATLAPDKEFYSLVLDTNNTMMTVDLPLGTNTSKNVFLIDGTERYSKFTVSKNFNLLPKTREDRFYLAYLYLANRQPKRSFMVLRSALKQDEPLNESEIEILRRILLEIPARIPKDITRAEDKARIHSPEFYAVRALTCSILAKQKLSDQPIKFHSIKMVGMENVVNKMAENIAQEKLKTFWSKEFTREANKIYKTYLEKLKKVPKDLHLSPEEELTILRAIPKKLSAQEGKEVKDAVGKVTPVSHRRKALDMQWLSDELGRLAEHSKTLEQSGKKLTLEQQQRQGRLFFKLQTLTPPPPRDDGIWEEFGEPDIKIPQKLKKPKLAKLDLFNDIKAERELFQQLYNKYKGMEVKEETERTINALLTPKADAEKITQLLYEEVRQEYVDGLKVNKELNSRNQASQEFCEMLKKEGADSLKGRLKKTLKDQHEDNDKKLKEMREALLKLANTPPKDPKALMEWNLRRASLSEKDLQFRDILNLYLTDDLNLYQSRTHLIEAEIEELHAKMHEFLLLATKNQYLKRVSKEIEKLEDPKIVKDAEQLDSVINKIGSLMSIQRNYNPELHPEILVFEYLDDKLLYKEQIDYLEALFAKSKDGVGFNSQAIQLIMGGGKSKVLLPILALKKATGTNLSILEVPDALFEINKADINATTLKDFGKKGHPFYFDDSVNCTSKYLLDKLKEFRKVMRDRDFLITTKESMQSFELKFIKSLRLKYIELISGAGVGALDKETILRIRYMSEILRLFKNEGDVLIDEIDSALDVRKQLIYTTGESQTVTIDECEIVYDLFDYLDKLSLSIEKPTQKRDTPEIKVNLKEILTGTKKLNKQGLNNYLENFVDQLLDSKNPNNPFKPIMTKLEDNLKNWKEQKILLRNFLLSKLAPPPPFMFVHLTASERDTFALIREEITTLLPLTLSRNLNEHFGSTQLPTKEAFEKEIAIPYLASNTPNERSRFGNYLETLNYSIQMKKYDVLSKDLLRSMVQTFKNEGEEKLRVNDMEGYAAISKRFSELISMPPEPGKVADVTKVLESGKAFEAGKAAEPVKFNLDEVDLDNPQNFDEFYKTVCKNSKVVKYCAINHALNHIEKNNDILASDAQNHASQFRSVQGMTGTDWNYRTYPNFVRQNKAVKGSDGQVLNYLLRSPIKPHLLDKTGKDANETFKIIEELFTQHANPQQLHAFIDLGAYFKGVTNKKVAESFSKYFKGNKKFEPVNYVLYFDKDDTAEGEVDKDETAVDKKRERLYALKVGSNEKPILLEQTNPEYIAETLKCTPDNYFTYYDQRRITGTDVNQALNAHALVSLGVKTLERDLLQAVMRLRDLKNAQRVEFVIPKEVLEANPDIKPDDWTVETVIKLCVDNQVERLSEDHYRSTIQKMKNMLRADLLKRILSLRAKLPKLPREQDYLAMEMELMNICTEVFFSKVDLTPFELYGGVKESDLTQRVLEQFKDDILIPQWKQLVNSFPNEVRPSDVEIDAFSAQMKSIITEALPVCYKNAEKLVTSKGTSQDGKEAKDAIDAKQAQDAKAAMDAKQAKDAKGATLQALPNLESQIQIERELETSKQLELETDYHFQGDVLARQKIDLKPIDLNVFKFDVSYWTQTNFGTVINGTLEAKLRYEIDRGRVPERNWTFDNNIFVTQDFCESIYYNNQLLNAYNNKDSVFHLVEQDDRTRPPSIRFLLLSMEEAAHFKRYLRDWKPPPGRHLWLETSHGDLDSGIKPKELHKDYNRGLEQIALFNGDSDRLYEAAKQKGSWIQEHAAEKLTFFEKVIKPLHKDKLDLTDLLKKQLVPSLEKPFPPVPSQSAPSQPAAGKPITGM